MKARPASECIATNTEGTRRLAGYTPRVCTGAGESHFKSQKSMAIKLGAHAFLRRPYAIVCSHMLRYMGTHTH